MRIELAHSRHKSWLDFKRRLKIMTGIDNIPRAIAEDKFRTMFSPDRDRTKLFVFAVIGHSISISMIGMTDEAIKEITDD